MKQKQNSWLPVALSALGSLALMVANTGIGITCYGIFCQPKFPEKLQKH